MKRFVLMSFIATLARCGPPPELEPEQPPDLIEGLHGPLVPMLSVNGELVPDAGLPNDWRPTGVAFDSRREGWRISCLRGLQLQFGAGDTPDSLRLFCVPRNQASGAP